MYGAVGNNVNARVVHGGESYIQDRLLFPAVIDTLQGTMNVARPRLPEGAQKAPPR